MSRNDQSAPVRDLSSADVLRRARALLERPEHWTQDTDKALSPGMPVCAGVALNRVYNVLSDDTFKRAVLALEKAIGGHAIIRWNDAPGRTHAEVLAAFDKAIAEAEAI